MSFILNYKSIATALMFTTGFSAADAETLKSAIAYGIKNSPSVSAAQASRRATESVLKQAKGRYLPEISLSADAGRQRIDRPEGFGPLVNKSWRTRRRVSLNFRQVLFDGFDRANDVYRSQARISSAALRVLARSESLALRVVESYIDVVRHQKLHRLAKKNVKRHRRLLALVSERVEGGQTSEGDLRQTRERLEAAKALVSQIAIALGTSKAKYVASVGKKPKSLRNVGLAKRLPKSPAAALQLAVENNPRLKSFQADIVVSEFDKEQFRSSLYPQIYFEGSASRGEDLDGTAGRSDELRGMIVLNWKIFDGGVRSSRISELEERSAVKVAEYDTLLRDVREQIDTSWVRYREGGRQVEAVRRQLNENIQVVKAYQKEYEANKRSLLDVLDSESSRFASEFDLSNVQSIQKFSSYQLVATTGRLLEYFGIEEPSDSELPDVSFSSSRSSKAFSNFKIPSLSGD